MKPVIVYFFDAYCAWCYGFDPVIRKIWSVYNRQYHIELIPGGMIRPPGPVHISKISSYILDSYKEIEQLTGVVFGEDFLWHFKNTALSDWFPDSEKPSIAFCIFREYFPGEQVKLLSDLHAALFSEGRDLCDDEAYRHLLERYKVPVQDFYSKLHSSEYKEMAHQEFALAQQLHVTGYPTVMIQESESRFHLVTRGYSSFETISQTIDSVINEIKIIHP
jgi:putative protein-disulfide isomerase